MELPIPKDNGYLRRWQSNLKECYTAEKERTPLKSINRVVNGKMIEVAPRKRKTKVQERLRPCSYNFEPPCVKLHESDDAS